RLLMGKRVSYRIATRADIPALARLQGYNTLVERDAAEWPLQQQFRSLEGNGDLLVAEIGGRLAGTAVVTRLPEHAALYPEWWIFSVFVRSNLRGAGVGEGLMKLALERVAQEGGGRVSLLVFDDNRPAIRLYKKLGFAPFALPLLDKTLREEADSAGRRRIILSRLVPPTTGG
ncbi:MAG TPA: GNAT family N-acetyltransferase, partial [Chloroflexia bacterium]|nr:GNAT family N-acetyltransferase [Chloroflexia bacterium]